MEKKGSKRRVLLIVNSYDDVKDVAEALRLKSAWAGRYRQLTRSAEGKDDTAYMRSELERFVHETADILIAPLLAISRGYNILDENKGSLLVRFSSWCVLIPFPMTWLI